MQLALSLVWALAASSPAEASSFRRISFEELVNTSVAVVQVRVLDTESAWMDIGTGYIATTAHLEVVRSLDGDFQVRASAFGSQTPAIRTVIASFARHAPAPAQLVFKTHPLDNGLERWGRLIAQTATDAGVPDRVHLADGGSLPAWLACVEGLVTLNSTAGLEALQGVDPAALDQLLHPTLDPSAVRDVLAKGLPASPGAASGIAVFDSDTAEKRAEMGDSVILVRMETSPEDIHGMHAAKGILTARGGMTSHAAVVARGMGSMRQEGAMKVLRGQTSVAEVLRVTQEDMLFDE